MRTVFLLSLLRSKLSGLDADFLSFLAAFSVPEKCAFRRACLNLSFPLLLARSSPSQQSWRSRPLCTLSRGGSQPWQCLLPLPLPAPGRLCLPGPDHVAPPTLELEQERSHLPSALISAAAAAIPATPGFWHRSWPTSCPPALEVFPAASLSFRESPHVPTSLQSSWPSHPQAEAANMWCHLLWESTWTPAHFQALGPLGTGPRLCRSTCAWDSEENPVSLWENKWRGWCLLLCDSCGSGPRRPSACWSLICTLPRYAQVSHGLTPFLGAAREVGLLLPFHR